jgi:hypothetical protein
MQRASPGREASSKHAVWEFQKYRYLAGSLRRKMMKGAKESSKTIQNGWHAGSTEKGKNEAFRRKQIA